MILHYCDSCNTRLTEGEAGTADSPESQHNGRYCAACLARMEAARKSQSATISGRPSAKSMPAATRGSGRTSAMPTPLATTAAQQEPVAAAGVARQSGPKAGVLILCGVGLVIFLVGLVSAFSGRTPPENHGPPATPKSATEKSQPRDTTVRTGSAEAKSADTDALSPEKRADAAFAAALKQLETLDANDKKARIAVLEEFLAQHGTSVVAARGRTMLKDLQGSLGAPTVTGGAQPGQQKPAVVTAPPTPPPPTPPAATPPPPPPPPAAAVKGTDDGEPVSIPSTAAPATPQAAYARFQRQFVSQLQKRNVENVVFQLDAAGKDQLLLNAREVKDRLPLERKAAEWLKATERAVLAGAEKLKDCEEFQLDLSRGDKYAVGKRGPFSLAALAGDILQISGGGLTVPVPVQALRQETRDRLAALALGTDAQGALLRAFVEVLALDRPDAGKAAGARETIAKARAAGAAADDVKYLLALVDEGPKIAMEAAAETDWRRIEPLFATAKWEELWEEMDDFQSEHGATQFAQERRAAVDAVLAQVGPGANTALAYCLRFDKAQDRSALDAAQGKHGALQNGAAWAADKGGAALCFDSASGCVDIPAAFVNGEPNWTWSGWLWPANSGSFYTEGNPGRTLALSINAGGAISANVWHRDKPGNWQETISRSGVVPFKAWSFIAVTLSDGGASKGTYKFYVNGKPVSSANGQAEFHPDTKFAALGDNIGAWRGSKQGHEYYQGRMKGVRVYKRALSDSEIRFVTQVWPPAPAAGTKRATAAAGAGKADAAPVFLCDMNEFQVSVGHGGFGKKGNLGYGDKRITYRGVESPHGLSMHAPTKGSARASYALGKAYRYLRATVALNDTSPGSQGPLMFKLFGDGKPLWQSGILQKRGDAQPCLVNVGGVDKLELVVECPAGNGNAHTVWLEPQVTK